MSLVPTFAQDEHNLYYKNPLLGDDTNDWFICFDDDDPIELVVCLDVGNQPTHEVYIKIEEILKTLNDKGFQVSLPRSERPSRSHRKRFENRRWGKLVPSASVFLHLEPSPIPSDMVILHDGTFEESPASGGPEFHGCSCFYKNRR